MSRVENFRRLETGHFTETEPLTNLEAEVLDIIIVYSNPEEGQIIGNKEIAARLEVSRKSVKRARISIAEKIDIIQKGF